MTEDQQSRVDNERIRFHFLLRNLPIKERAAWLQVCGNQSHLYCLEQWIHARKVITELFENLE